MTEEQRFWEHAALDAHREFVAQFAKTGIAKENLGTKLKQAATAAAVHADSLADEWKKRWDRQH